MDIEKELQKLSENLEPSQIQEDRVLNKVFENTINKDTRFEFFNSIFIKYSMLFAFTLFAVYPILLLGNQIIRNSNSTPYFSELSTESIDSANIQDSTLTDQVDDTLDLRIENVDEEIDELLKQKENIQYDKDNPELNSEDSSSGNQLVAKYSSNENSNGVILENDLILVSIIISIILTASIFTFNKFRYHSKDTQSFQR